MTDREALMRFRAVCDGCGETEENCKECVNRYAISALQDQEERSKGCGICDGIHSPNTLDGFMRMGYEYCPMCGRKLKGGQDER